MVDVLRVTTDDFNDVPANPYQPHTIHVRTAREMLDLPEPPESDLLLGPFVVKGFRTVIVGDTGHGKTTLSMQMASAILTGAHCLGYQGAGAGPVLVVDLEQGQRSIKRLIRENNLGGRDDLLYAAIPDGLELDTNDKHKTELERIIVSYAPSMLILDPYYKAHRADSNEERGIVDLMRFLDELRSAYGFNLTLPAHPRKEHPSNAGSTRKLSLSDVFGSSAVTRGAEMVIAIERVNHGFARLRYLKDRDFDSPVGEALDLFYSKEHGFTIDDKPARDLGSEIAAWLVDNPMSTTNDVCAAVDAGRQTVSKTLKTDARFTSTKGQNRSFLWCVQNPQTHLIPPGTTQQASGASGGASPVRGTAQTNYEPGASNGDGTTNAETDLDPDYLAYLETIADTTEDE